jgi:hypothetical protein
MKKAQRFAETGAETMPASSLKAPVPYRSVDAELERLGSSTHEYRRSKLAIARAFLLASVALTLSFSLLGDVVAIVTRGSPNYLFPAMVSFPLGLVMAGFAVLLVGRALHPRGLSLDLRALGFIHRLRGVETVVLWEEVARIDVTWKSVRRFARDTCAVTTRDGRRVELTEQLAGIAEVRGVVERECTRCLLPVALKEIEAGRAVSFGPFVATSEGLAHGEDELDWEDVKGALIVRGMIAIGDTTDRVRVLPKRGGVVAWATAGYADVPNAAVLLALVERLTEGSRT